VRSLVQKPTTAPPVVHDVLRSPGRPLEPSVVGPMEGRFGHDFSRVRVHTDEQAAESARAVGALAYTVGRDVVFDSGRYAPASVAGGDLLAHELAHVVQQRGASGLPDRLPVSPANDPLEREADSGQPASRAEPQVQRQDIGERRLRYEETLPGDPTQTGGIWTGSVERTARLEEFKRAPAIAANALMTFDLAGSSALRSTMPGKPARDEWQQVSSRSFGQVALEYDEGACELRIPSRLVFHNPGPGQLPSPDPCAQKNPAPARPLDAGTFAGLRTAFTRTVNERLNRWYSLSLEGCGKGAPCARGVSIRVVATDTSGGGTGPQVDVWLINAHGRSCAEVTGAQDAFIYAPEGEADPAMWAHEGGHFALHYGDEYSEAPHPDERVHEEDFSGMANRSMSRLALLHERHFAFAPLFVNRVMELSGRSCRASLQTVQRPSEASLSGTLSAGYLGSPTGRGLYLDLGFQLGAPLTRRRELETIIGVHGRMLAQLEKENQLAFLVGVRGGLEGTIPLTRSGTMLNIGAYGELGQGLFSALEENVRAPYGEVGGYASLRFQGSGTGAGFIGIEAARGGRLDLSGRVPDPGTAGPWEWTRYGIWLGIQH
jgi:uncharacterized protein DUF4157